MRRRVEIGQPQSARLFLDVTRICSRIFRSTPTGIDRVDMDYLLGAARRSADLSLDCVLTTPWFSGLLPRAEICRLAESIQKNWDRSSTLAEDAAYGELRRCLENGWRAPGRGCTRIRADRPGLTSLAVAARPALTVLRAPHRLGTHLRRPPAEYASWYLNTSHTQLEHGSRFEWLRCPGIAPVFFIHDTIPVDYPEFCSPGSASRHEGRLKTVSEEGALVIVNSCATRDSLIRYWEDRGMRIPDLHVVPLGVRDCFNTILPLETIKSERPYFICTGTIEPRKNHMLLFAVWRHLVETMGEDAPVLVLVGRRGWENENICDVLDRSRQLSPHILEVSGLGDLGVAALMRSAHGLLAPSMAEGFGLPVAEALAMRVPVIASDIAAHREASKERAHLISPLDTMAWAQAVQRQAEDPGWVGRIVERDPGGYRSATGGAHVDAVLNLLLDRERPNEADMRRRTAVQGAAVA